MEKRAGDLSFFNTRLNGPLNKEEICRRIPHGVECLLIDNAVIHSPEALSAEFHCTGGESFFTGHYPFRKVLPGHIILEAMGQGGALLAGYTPDFAGQAGYLATVERMRFRKMLVPPFEARIEVRLEQRKLNMGWFHGRMSLDGHPDVAEGRWIIRFI